MHKVSRGTHSIEIEPAKAIGTAGTPGASVEQVRVSLSQCPVKIKKFSLGCKEYVLGMSNCGTPEWRLV